MRFIKRLFKKKEKGTLHILPNVLNTSHQKVALLAYIKSAFESDYTQIPTTHTNIYTTIIIAEILNELGYNVDVINWSDSFEGDTSKYELIFGLGKPVEDILLRKPKDSKPKIISFGTGCNPLFSDPLTFARGKEFYYKKGRFLMQSLRYSEENWTLQHEIPDWIIVHGDKFCTDTYRKYAVNSVLAPVFIYHQVERTDEDWQKAKPGYLWFGSRGGIHKGLDLCIETFKTLPELTLHICGDFGAEPEFMEIYKEDIENSDNIHFHGYVDIQTDVYKEILASCAFMIFPSISEGNSPSVITCMANGGLIPVVPLNADVNMEEYGIEIKGFNLDFMREAIHESQQLSVEQLKEQSAKILITTKKYHTFDYFKTDFKNKLAEALFNIEK